MDNNVLEDALDELEHDDEVNHDYVKENRFLNFNLNPFLGI